MWDLWLIKWHWDRFSPSTLVFPCQFLSTGAPLLGKMKKKLIIFLFIFITRVEQYALRLRCVRSICCGALLKKKVGPSQKPLPDNTNTYKRHTSFYKRQGFHLLLELIRSSIKIKVTIFHVH